MTKRFVCFFLVFLLAFNVLACKSKTSIAPKDAAVTPSPNVETLPFELEPDSSDIPESVLEPVPTPSYDSSASDKFKQLDLDVFRWYVTSDGYTLTTLLSNPQQFGIDQSSVPMKFGDFSEEYFERLATEAQLYLDSLHSISRMSLSDTEQLSYDILEQYLIDISSDSDYDFFYEPLTAYDGIHSELPLIFALYEMNSKQDVENYLALLADVPRYLKQVLVYEQEKAERGLFMREEALDQILDDCNQILRTKNTSFLYTTFRDALDDITELTTDEKEMFLEKNDDLISNDFIDAYSDLYDGLKKLRKYCRGDKGVNALGKNGADYFVYRMQKSGNNLLSPDETLELLKNEIAFILSEAANLSIDNDLLFDGSIISVGTVSDDIQYVKNLSEQLLPALPEHTLTLDAFPEELEEMMSPACFVIPSLDEWQKNRIFINRSVGSDTLLLTSAHESYPGHLYQYVYQRGNADYGYMQRALHFGGYSEGWAQMAEYLVADVSRDFSDGLVKLHFYDSIFSNALLPATVSILVNYYGYSEKAIVTYVSGLNLSEEYADFYYDLAIDQPYYALEYAVGYAQLSKLMRDAEMDLGDDFDRSEFLQAYLDLGPGYFNLLSERMHMWIEEKMHANIL